MMMTPLFVVTERAFRLFWYLFFNHHCVLRFFLDFIDFNRLDFNHLRFFHLCFLNGNDFKFDLNLFYFFYLGQRDMNVSSNINLHIFLSFEESLHDINVFITQDSDIIIILIEEGDVQGRRNDIEFFADEGNNFIVLDTASKEFDFFFEL